MRFFNIFLTLSLLVAISACGESHSSEPPEIVLPPEEIPSTDDDGRAVTAPGTWVATDALGREIGTVEQYGAPRKDRTVAMFYYIWLGAHGYDRGENHNEVLPPSSGDVKSPYDITQLLEANSANPAWGPEQAFHHWSQPWLGYYVSNDEWVIEKHIQMLTDAGVDVLFFDNTNAYTYVATIKVIGKVMDRMKAQGRRTLKFASLLHTNPDATLQTLYDNIYSKNIYKDYWFYWDGKPLVLSPFVSSATLRAFFTFRDSWFNTGKTEDQWDWAALYPQTVGTHKGVKEQIPVSAATHPTSNIGRSYHTGFQPANPTTVDGLFFQEQWNRAIAEAPRLVLLTNWNEWVAQRFIQKGSTGSFIGKSLPVGGTYFVDEYNEEYSRDIEPERGRLGDNYYYQMVDNIRRYKGVQAITPAKGTYSITIDGETSDWKDVAPIFADDSCDITPRNHYGWGRVGTLINNSGRNDFVKARVATDGTNAFFLMKTASPVVFDGDLPLQLFIKGGNGGNSWEGYGYRVDVKADRADFYVCLGGWKWQQQGSLACKVKGNVIELSLLLQKIGLPANTTPLTIDFKWTDNMPQNGQIMDLMDNGDTAPNGRFRYRYMLE